MNFADTSQEPAREIGTTRGSYVQKRQGTHPAVRLGEDGTGRIHFLVATEAMISLQGKGVFKAVYRTGRRLIAVTVPVIPATGNASNRLALSHAYR
jgi:hypothetical protein